jgi:hypothetical protein
MNQGTDFELAEASGMHGPSSLSSEKGYFHRPQVAVCEHIDHVMRFS